MYIYIYIDVCVYVYIYMYRCMYISILMWSVTERREVRSNSPTPPCLN